MSVKKIGLALAILAVLAAYYFFDGRQYLSVDFFRDIYRREPLLTAGVYFAVYVLATAFSLPAAAFLTVIGGMLFGLWWGTLLASFASTLGATLAFLFSRYLLRDWVQARLGRYLRRINEGVKRDGAFYLFSLRLIPIFPFWVLNLAFGLTPLRTGTYYVASQLGMLPATAVYVNAGAQLGQVESFTVQGVLTPGLLVSLALIAVFPFLARGLVNLIQRRRLFRGFDKPGQFDTNLVVIGAGSAGLVAAYIAATVKARVTLIERGRMGGDCLNTGCVPSKSLIRAARVVAEIRKGRQLGVEAGDYRVDFPKIMNHVHGAIEAIAPNDSVERYTELGVDCITGDARLESPWAVRVDGRTITTRGIVIATGARPAVPAIPGLADLDYLTSENLWDIHALPNRLLVMGGGPVGCELAQAFQRLGARVTLVQRRDRLLPREDAQASRVLADVLREEGVEVVLEHEVVAFESRGGENFARLESRGHHRTVPFDRVLVAVGRQPRTGDLGLDKLNIPTNADGSLQVNDFLQTRYPNIYACGDVAGPYQYTHAASHQAWYAAVNALFGGFRKFRADYRVIPAVTFTDPEVASVGLNEQTAAGQDIEVEVTCYPLAEADRAIADAATSGFVKVFTSPGKDRILGATIMAPHAGDMLAEFVAAMKHGYGLNKILGTIHSYPTLGEANKMAAGRWKQKHKPEKLLRWVGRYHRWRRGG